MTAELPQPPPNDELRASHDDREAVVERLQTAAIEGRIDFTELDSRLELALRAKTHADLLPLTADLPPVALPDVSQPLVLKAGMHGLRRAGRWHVPARITVTAGSGGVKLDFTQAVCRFPEVELDVRGDFGGVVLIVPEGWMVETASVDPGMGGVRDKTSTIAERPVGAPLLKLTGTGGVGGVVVRHLNSWERRRIDRERRKLARRNSP